MTIQNLNIFLQQLTAHSLDTSITTAQSIMQLMGIEMESKKVAITNTSITLQNMLVENPIVKGQSLFYQLSSSNQQINCRLAIAKKINKQTIYRLVSENGFNSWQANINNAGTDYLPYTIDFITTKQYNQLTVIITQGEQIRTINLKPRLTNLQVNKILPKWQDISKQTKAIINTDLWSSLDIKEVNKQFYISIKEKFDTLIDLIKIQHPDTEANQQKMFAIKLIGRYLFCWFLKEKEIIPVQALASASLNKHTDIYNQIIHPLFFITLNTLPQPEREYPDYVPQEFIKLFANIPYLNGGLFEESEEDKLIDTLQIDTWLIQFIQFLEEYNFTVDESSPNYEQLAIDPEMLGRILENLLASLNTETQKMANERKSLGAFYTPRIIVDYMVTESLKYYLQGKLLPDNNAGNNTAQQPDIITTSNKKPNLFSASEPKQLAINIDKLTKVEDDKEAYIKNKIDKLFNVWDDTNPLTKTETQIVKDALQQCKIIDPACGSGAFPMGILHKLEMLNEKLGTDKSAYKLRRHILSQNIYGVDILPIAVEISRLRAWLSLILVSDFKSTDKKHNFGIEALPNLDFKFVCANALISNGYDEFIALAKQSQIPTLIRLNTEIEYLEDIRNEYFNSSNTDNKKKQLIQNFAAKKEYIKQNFRLQKDKLNINDFLDKIDDWNPFNDSKASSFFSPAWMLGVTGGFDVVIGNPPYVRQESAGLDKSHFQKNFKSFSGKADLYVFFYELAINLLNTNGVLCYITSSKFIKAGYGKPLLSFLANEAKLNEVIDFNDLPVFNGITTYPVIVSASKKRLNNYGFSYYNLTELPTNSLLDLLKKSFLKTLTKREFVESDFKFIDGSHSGLIKNIKRDTLELKSFCNSPVVGIKTGLNEAYITDLKTANTRPYVFGRDVKKYQSIVPSKNIIFPYNDDFSLIPLDKLSDVSEILNKYKIELSNRAIIKEGLEKKNKAWYEFQQVNKTINLKETHIIYPNVSFGNNFCLAENVAIDMTAFIINSNSLFLLALLNSKLIEFLMKLWGIERRGGYIEYKTQYVEKLPIKNADTKAQQPFINHVNKILAAKGKNPKAVTTKEEREIDIMVYHLYSLTYNDAKLIDATLTEAEFEKYKN